MFSQQSWLQILFDEITLRQLFIFSGTWSERLVILILFIKPLAVITNSIAIKKMLLYRRQLGITASILFAFHGLGFIYINRISFLTETQPFLFLGLIAGIGMTCLGLTSNNFAMRVLKKNWKRIQGLAYPTFFLILAHSGLAENGNLKKLFVIGGAYLILRIWQLIKQQPAKNQKNT